MLIIGFVRPCIFSEFLHSLSNIGGVFGGLIKARQSVCLQVAKSACVGQTCLAASNIGDGVGWRRGPLRSGALGPTAEIRKSSFTVGDCPLLSAWFRWIRIRTSLHLSGVMDRPVEQANATGPLLCSDADDLTRNPRLECSEHSR